MSTRTTDQRLTARARRQRGYYTVTDVGALLGIADPTVHHYVSKGVFPKPRARCGGVRRYFTQSDLDQILAIWATK